MGLSKHVADEAFKQALAGTPYRYVALLGSGGMGSVVEAEHTGLAKPVALKLLLEEMCDSPELIDRMRIEAQALARIEHPNLVRVLDFAMTPAGRAYLAMERLDGVTLAFELERRGWLPVSESLGIVAQAARGLAAAQALGLVHRDVKPQNLFLCHGPEPRLVKVLDFGIAKVVEDAVLSRVLPPQFVTRTGFTMGTPRYSAPEQITGGPVSPATDVYAAGIVLYRCLTGRHPFAHWKNLEDIQRAHLFEMPRRPSEVGSQPISPEVDRLVLRAMAKWPADRFVTAADLAREIEAVLSGTPASLDSRTAPTLTSEPRPLPRTDAPTVATGGPPMPRLPSGQTVLAVPREEAQPPEFPEAARSVSRGWGEALGIGALLAGVANLAWNTVAIQMEVFALVDPLGFVTAYKGPPPPDGDIALYTRLGASVEIVRYLMLAAIGAALVWIGIRFLRKSPGAYGLTRIWSTWSLVAVVVGTLIEIAVVLPLNAMLNTAMRHEVQAQALGFGLSLVHMLATGLMQAAFIVAFRVGAGRLERAAAANLSRGPAPG